MAGSGIRLVFALLLFGCASASTETIPFPPVSACGAFDKAPNDEVTRKATAAFLEHTHGRIRHYKVSRQDCGETFLLFFESVGEDANVGYHWFILYTKAAGEIRIIDGI